MGTALKWTRRALLGAGGLVGGGLVLGVGVVAFAPDRLTLLPPAQPDHHWLTAWLKIAGDGTVTVVVPHCDMGQGAQTALAMMAAEELDADWSRVVIEEAPAEDAYANAHIIRAFLPGEVPAWASRGFDWTTYKLAQAVGLQVTGGSASVRSTGRFGMQVAGAAARTMLLQAAAQRWSVPLDQLEVSQSQVVHAATSRSAHFGELAAEAAQSPVPASPVLKSRKQWRLLGTSPQRRDIVAKTDGSLRYGIDVQLPGLLHASVRAAPVQGSTLLSVDEAPARAMPGVQAVIKLPDAVAVVASSWWQAEQAIRKLQPQFSSTSHDGHDSAAWFAAIEASLSDASGVQHHGDVDAALNTAAQRLDVRYQLPLLAHAALEPLNATVRHAEGRCEVWAGTQDPLAARKVAAAAAGLSTADVTLHNLPLGGSFGRRLPGSFDYIDQATRIAKAMSPSPVKLLWSRSEDLQHDYYRPAMVAKLQGSVDATGKLTAWRARYNGGGEAAAGVPPYQVDALDLRSSKPEAPVREGSWRSVGFSQQCFVIESFIDELAQAAQQDPLAFRLAALHHAPRHRAVLQAAAQRAQWGEPLPAGQGRGIALVEAFGSLCAQVAQVQILADGTIRVLRLVAAVDCGPVIHPDAALAQVQGGMLFGMSAALQGEITLAGGRVQQTGFGDYPQLRIDAAPQVDVEFLVSDAPLGGLGEPGVPPVAPALANAIYAATGKRLRQLPLQRALREA